MHQIAMQATKREKTGKGANRELRRNGFIPAVIYGRESAAISLNLKTRDLEKFLAKESVNSLIDIKIEGENEKILAMIKEVQSETISSRLVHVDLIRVSLDKTVEAHVPIELINTDELKREGGVISLVLNDLLVACFPDKIPDIIEIDMSRFNIGEMVHVKDIELGEGLEIVSEPDEVVAHVLSSKLITESPTEEPAEESAEAAQDSKPSKPVSK